MRLIFSGDKSTINVKTALIIFGIMLLAGIVFSVVQITIASSNPNPGHVLSQIADFTCGSGNCLQSLTNGSLGCVACSGGGGGVTGSGTTNSISKWTGSTSIGNSSIRELVSGTYGIGVGIGKDPEVPSGGTQYWPLDVAGAIHTSWDVNADNRIRGTKICIGGEYGTDTNCKSSWPTLSCYYQMSQVTKASGSGFSIVSSISCPAGTGKATGGGCNCYGAGGSERFIMTSYPSSSLDRWYCGCQNDDQATWAITMDMYVICCQ